MHPAFCLKTFCWHFLEITWDGHQTWKENAYYTGEHPLKKCSIIDAIDDTEYNSVRKRRQASQTLHLKELDSKRKAVLEYLNTDVLKGSQDLLGVRKVKTILIIFSMLFVFFQYIDICTDGSRAIMDKIADTSTWIKWYQAVLLFIFSTPTHSQYQKN